MQLASKHGEAREKETALSLVVLLMMGLICRP